MKYAFFLILCVAALALGCGDDDDSNANNIISPDLGETDMNQMSDMGEDAATDMPGFDPDMEGPRPTVVVDPAEAAVQPTKAAILEASYFDPDGNQVLEAEFAWSSEDETIATVDEFGGVLGVAAGFVDIIAAATSDGTEGRATVNVHTANRQLAVGRAHTCTSKADGRATCWGDTSLGQLGAPANGMLATTPIRMDFFPEEANIVGVRAGDDHTCTFDDAGKAYCWGRNHKGQLGNGTTMSSPVPLERNFASPVIELALGQSFTCARLEDGTLRCWGENLGRVLQDSPATEISDPVTVHGNRTWSKVVAGTGHVCALDVNDVWCWGADDSSQLGPDGNGNTHTPTQVPGVYVNIWASHDLTCAHTFTDTLECWGASAAGLGDGVTFESANPVETTFPNNGVTNAAIGLGHICVVASNQTYCWGQNDRGQLGDNTLDTRGTPVSVMNGNGFIQLSLGDKHSCGRSQRGDVFCWGSNVLGQVGDGTDIDRREAIYVQPTAN